MICGIAILMGIAKVLKLVQLLDKDVHAKMSCMVEIMTPLVSVAYLETFNICIIGDIGLI